MRKIIPYLASAAALLACVAGCRDIAAENAAKLKKILAPFEGEWTVVSLEREGKKSTAAALRDTTVTVADGKFTLVEIGGTLGGGGGGVKARQVTSEEYFIQADPTKPPGEVEFAYAAGDNVGQTRPGIYTFDGDKLTLALAKVGDPRPTQVGGGKLAFVLERKPKQ